MRPFARPFVSLLTVATLVAFSAAGRAAPAAPAVERGLFGRTPEGREVAEFTLRSRGGVSARIITYGAIVADLRVPDRTGATVSVVREIKASEQGFQRGFAQSAAIFGRVANRIGLARLMLDGREIKVTANAGKHHIHGGRTNFSRVVWTPAIVERPNGAAVQLEYVSPDGEEGFPGTVTVRVTYVLTHDNVLRLEYEARTDRPTPINLTNHAFFNLAGAGDVTAHELTLNADRYTLADADLIPTGEIASVRGTPLDFTRPAALGARAAQLGASQRYDHNFVLNRGSRADALEFAARVRDPQSGRVMEVWTTEPGMQLFSTPLQAAGAEGRFGFYCFETQHFPDSVNHPNFPSTILRPGEVFRSATEFRFFAK